jgi:hypothetical protein
MMPDHTSLNEASKIMSFEFTGCEYVDMTLIRLQTRAMALWMVRSAASPTPRPLSLVVYLKKPRPADSYVLQVRTD